MKLYDFHVHTSGISKCSRLTPRQLCDVCLQEGLGGFVLTNHYAPRHVEPLTVQEWLVKYQREYEITSNEAQKRGLRCFFGMEVTISGKDYLVYGLPVHVLFESDRPLYEYSLAALSEFVHQRGGLLIHAHPFRNGGQPSDPLFLDGYEVNCHPLYGDNFSKKVHETAQKAGLLVTCGSDYHADVYKAHCGVYLPDEIEDEGALAAFLKKGQPLLLEHEIDVERARKTCIYG